MGSEKRRISSDSGDAYARVVRREELQQELEQKGCQDDITQPDADDKAENGDSDVRKPIMLWSRAGIMKGVEMI